VRHSRGSVLGILAAFAALSIGGTASAQDKQACVNASEHAQHLRTDGKLGEARDELIVCAREVCPIPVRKDCAQWLSEVETARPSVVVSARDTTGRDVSEVRVIVDGKVLAQHLDGKAIFVDPGHRAFRYETKGAPTVEDDVLVREGEKSRVLRVTFPTGGHPADGAHATATPETAGPDAAARSGGVPTASWVLGALGVAATGSFLYFGVKGRGEFSDLRSSCAPDCNPTDVDPIRTKLIIADISLGVAVVSFGIAVVLALTHPGSPPTSTVATGHFRGRGSP